MTQKDFESKVNQLKRIADDLQREGEHESSGLLTNMGLFIELMLLTVAKDDFQEFTHAVKGYLKYKSDQENKVKSLLKGLEIN